VYKTRLFFDFIHRVALHCTQNDVYRHIECTPSDSEVEVEML